MTAMLAKSGPEGIPARTNVPGTAPVTTYAFDGTNLTETGTEVVYNLASGAVAPDRWLMIQRIGDHWFVTFEDYVCPTA